ncbi:hypothetical protein [Streptomyces rugosispiralis]|uniref:Uncharacterized protein n=1 Tax=Streptomyces rugosispiralis TaxID=2967341 RepID=A0ABT1UT34_9ACTN|nr:hypothetical protein [Streptomyces rugosispiralis]MCQ8188258.1 hypothetical protein [Streptomyces rugosispiralis]
MNTGLLRGSGIRGLLGAAAAAALIDQQTVNTVRSAGGDVIPSFGGWSGNKLESSWTIMPFDFGGAGQNMGQLTIRAAEGLKNTVKSAYGYSDDQAYRHSGISSMNGITDNSETVTVDDFRTILGYAQQKHLARLTFWSVNRDRPCTGGGADTCSGVSQQPWDFTRVFAQYGG